MGATRTGDLAGIFADHSSDNGVWRYYGGSWIRITDPIPANIAPWSSNSAAMLVKGYGAGEDGI